MICNFLREFNGKHLGRHATSLLRCPLRLPNLGWRGDEGTCRNGFVATTRIENSKPAGNARKLNAIENKPAGMLTDKK